MGDVVPYQGRVAGAALLLSVGSIVLGLLIVARQGRMHGLTAGFRGVEGIGEAASALSTMARVGLPYTIFQLVGFGVLAVMLWKADEGLLATLSFSVLILASAVSVFRGAFEGTVTVWAAGEWATHGTVPEMYKTLWEWVNSLFAIAYFSLLVSMVGFGWGVLRAGLLPNWVGWASIAWSILWIVGYLFGVGLPAIILLFPLIYGIGLLLS